MSDIEELTIDILAFRNERDWAAFHTPRNLAAGLSVEAAELQETMLWKTDNEVSAMLLEEKGSTAVRHEIADVLIYSLLLCHTLGIAPIAAIREKLALNAAKYPV